MNITDRKSIERELSSLFIDVFKTQFTEEELNGLQFKKHPQWDSLTQMILVQEIEAKFDIKFDFTDLMYFTSYNSGLELITKKLGV